MFFFFASCVFFSLFQPLPHPLKVRRVRKLCRGHRVRRHLACDNRFLPKGAVFVSVTDRSWRAIIYYGSTGDIHCPA